MSQQDINTDSAVSESDKAREITLFRPPESFRFESELLLPTPRPIPAELMSGRYASGTRLFAIGSLVGGLVAIAGHSLPLVQTWALYFLPLGYLQWIGAVFAIVGLFRLASLMMHAAPFRYVRDGVPIGVRVNDIGFVPTMITHGQATRYCCVGTIE